MSKYYFVNLDLLDFGGSRECPELMSCDDIRPVTGPDIIFDYIGFVID